MKRISCLPADAILWPDEVDTLRDNLPHLLRAVEERGALRFTFDVLWKLARRASAAYNEAHGEQRHVWPDHTKLLVWLMEQHDQQKQQLTLLTEQRDAALWCVEHRDKQIEELRKCIAQIESEERRLHGIEQTCINMGAEGHAMKERIAELEGALRGCIGGMNCTCDETLGKCPKCRKVELLKGGAS